METSVCILYHNHCTSRRRIVACDPHPCMYSDINVKNYTWHTFWDIKVVYFVSTISGIISHIPSDILSGALFDILADIYSHNSCGIAFVVVQCCIQLSIWHMFDIFFIFYLEFSLAFHYIFYLAFYLTFFLAFYLTYILTWFLSLYLACYVAF